MSTFQGNISRGLASARPSALSTTVGALYFSTDTGAVERNNGTTWDIYNLQALIQEQLLVGDVASVTFAAIPQTYRHLRLTILGRLTEAVTDNYVYIQFNADTGANYDYQQITGVNTSIAGSAQVAQVKIRLGELVGASASSANMAGHLTVDIPYYSGAVWNKLTNALCAFCMGTTTGSLEASHTIGHWRNNAAITSIVVLPSANNFKTGSLFSLYGLL